jgi:hypothetical protein
LKIKSQRDFWSGLLFVLLGIAFAWWSAAQQGFAGAAQPGSSYLPFGLGLLLAATGGLVLFKALTIEAEGNDPIGAWGWRSLLVIITAVACFGWLLPRLGMLLSLPMLVVASCLGGADSRWKEVLAQALLVTFGGWVVLVWGLQLKLPLWPDFLVR